MKRDSLHDAKTYTYIHDDILLWILKRKTYWSRKFLSDSEPPAQSLNVYQMDMIWRFYGDPPNSEVSLDTELFQLRISAWEWWDHKTIQLSMQLTPNKRKSEWCVGEEPYHKKAPYQISIHGQEGGAGGGVILNKVAPPRETNAFPIFSHRQGNHFWHRP